jgi:cell division protein FtsZ
MCAQSCPKAARRLMAVGHASGEDRRSRGRGNGNLQPTAGHHHRWRCGGILFNVTGGSQYALFEVNQAAAIIKETAHPEVNLIFGAVIDRTGRRHPHHLIATGFDRAATRSL